MRPNRPGLFLLALALALPALAHAQWLPEWSDNFDAYNVQNTSGTSGWLRGLSSANWDTRDSQTYGGAITCTTDSTSGHERGFGNNTGVDNHFTKTGLSYRNLELTVRFRTSDNDGMGLVYRYVDSRNFSMVVFSRDDTALANGTGQDNNLGSRGYHYEVVNGRGTRVDTGPTNHANTYTQNAWQRIRIRAVDNQVEIWLNTSDDNDFSNTERRFNLTVSRTDAGTVGLYAWANNAATFDDLVVRLHDADRDNVPDDRDNCPTDANASQADFDDDKLGDACDPDIDEDGSLNAPDCDDFDDAVAPGKPEICDGKDNDCNGQVDDSPADDSAVTYYRDADGDGRGVESDTVIACSPPSGYVSTTGDCDDEDAYRFLGNPELCDDKDNDCDTTIDEEAIDRTFFYADTDGDSFGDANASQRACTPPTGFVADDTDCDDANGTIHPDADEQCNGYDDNCDGQVDGDDAINRPSWYQDADNDSYGKIGVSVLACAKPSGYAANSTDCDDTSSSINPVASERCNDLDDDCDGDVDEDIVTQDWWPDLDGDGHGSDAATPVRDCAQPSRHVANRTDCDDTRSSINPSADERCNGLDDDCDGTTDEEATDAATWYADEDRDGYPNEDELVRACSRPAGFTPPRADGEWDCDDTVASVRPGAPELCNSVDDNCDGAVDETTEPVRWYADADRDGYGDPQAPGPLQCEVPSGDFAAAAGDCDDGDADVFPGAAEFCNGVDDDCDGTVDEPDASDASYWYLDTDGDGYGEEGSSTQRACESLGTQWVSEGGDCGPGDPDIHPGADETCDGFDQDCNGEPDNDPIDGADTWPDADDDGFGDANATPFKSCEAPQGSSHEGGDCDDDDPTIHPEVSEIPGDGIDQDCDGVDGAPEAPRPFEPLDADSAGAGLPPGCGCTAAVPSNSLLWLSPLLLFGLSRRRRA